MVNAIACTIELWMQFPRGHVRKRIVTEENILFQAILAGFLAFFRKLRLCTLRLSKFFCCADNRKRAVNFHRIAIVCVIKFPRGRPIKNNIRCKKSTTSSNDMPRSLIGRELSLVLYAAL